MSNIMLGIFVIICLVGIMVSLDKYFSSKKKKEDGDSSQDIIQEVNHELSKVDPKRIRTIEESLDSMSRNIGMIAFIVAVQFLGGILLVILAFSFSSWSFSQFF